jgi:hypothetical protein
MDDIDSLPCEPHMHEYWVSFGEGPNSQLFEFCLKNILEVLEQLVGDPRFKSNIDYVPHKDYTDKSRTVCVYGETSSGNWHWRMQV